MAMSDISDDFGAPAVPTTIPIGTAPPNVGAPQQPLDVAQLLQALIQLMQNQSARIPTGSQSPPPSGAEGPPGLGRNHLRLDEKYFRRINVFSNKAEAWKEWQVHFLAAVRDTSPQLAAAM